MFSKILKNRSLYDMYGEALAPPPNRNPGPSSGPIPDSGFPPSGSPFPGSSPIPNSGPSTSSNPFPGGPSEHDDLRDLFNFG